MRFSSDPAYFEAIANHPKVFPAVSCKGIDRIEIGPLWHECIGIEADGGGWLLHSHGHGLYEVHTLFLPKTRHVRQQAREALRMVFCGTDALELVTKVPDDLPHALALAKAMGFTVRFRREGAWVRESGAVGMTFLGLTLDEWARGDEALPALGAQFHEKLGEHKDHDDDPAHDRYVGLGIACAQSGQPEKGLWLYNRWARFAGYRPLSMKDGAVSFDGITLRVNGQTITMERQGCPQEQ